MTQEVMNPTLMESIKKLQQITHRPVCCREFALEEACLQIVQLNVIDFTSLVEHKGENLVPVCKT
jgi:hypothetical protein